ncbi:tRNA (N6-threonylcarbamoyladenosine(37)-N6)-methyltransferase TrmO [Desulfovibrio inopinatus]|uniref:tRNA (N6-threonylcarbamoyladenosine(37)-N6)-methyltransferase TrmO n=1 Tax=Desulfovibrio inopinatus TaxID=102109 RepID=UPI000405D9EE|nr:tRNA (N6-threonylcarbamoyladenosine(37)-N6)-methyltransferase TrmO [Desulfovibrio inopinatus]
MDVSAIGVVRSSLKDVAVAPKNEFEGAPMATIELKTPYLAGLDGVQPGTEIIVLTWLHQADRNVLAVHPRGDASREKRGVFSTRSPDRPNPIGIHRVAVLGLDGGRLTVSNLEAIDGTPVIDIKCIRDRNREQAFAAGIAPNDGNALIEAGRLAWQRGLVAGFNGNLSLRQANTCIITASGCAKGHLKPSDLVALDIDSGNVIGGTAKASTETGLHLEIYRRQPEAHAIVHCHPPHLLSLSLLQTASPLLSPPLYEADVFRNMLTQVPAITPGTQELADAAGDAATRTRAVFLRRHGLVCWGTSLIEALGLTEEMESLARIQLLMRG